MGREIGGVRLESKLGAGGMASVYAGADVERSDVRCAVKLLSVASHDHYRERFQREAQIGATLDHSSLVRVYRSGTSGDFLFMVMDLVEGEDLAHVLAREGPLEWPQVAALGRDVARALAALHARGIVHRDLKPGNVLLDGRGGLRLADFGLARWREAPSDLRTEAPLTATGDAFGTPIYMAPEQFVDAKTAGPPADLYALGVILFEALTGQPPFRASRPHALMQLHREVPPPSLDAQAADAPPPLRETIELLLEKDPEARPAGAEEVAERLARLVAGADTSPIRLEPPPGSTHRLWKGRSGENSTVPPRRRPTRVGVAIAIAIAAALGIGALVWSIPSLRVHLASAEERASYQALVEALGELDTAPTAFVQAVDQYGRDFGQRGLLRDEVAALRHRPHHLRANVYLVATDGAAMIHVPAGKYTIGHAGDPVEGVDLAPRRTVRLPGFLIDRAEVSNQRYLRFWAEWMAAGGIHRCGRTDPDHRLPDAARHLSDAPDAPAVGLSPYDALEYARFYGRRLPSEDEWEVAASWDPQGNEARPYPWGAREPSSNDYELANLSFAEYGMQDETGAFVTTCAPTGLFELDRSGFGLLDAAGNASEWCQGSSPLPGEQPLRGGSIETTNPKAALLSARRLLPPEPQPLAGFRTAVPFEP